ncbi:MAG: putative toxin-antitoxin system toxin component, PIN family [Rhodothermia bacterium]
MKVVCDTNVLISAILFGGRPRDVLRRMIEGKATGYTSPELRLELAGVLGRKKFSLAHEHIDAIMRLIDSTFIEVFPNDVPSIIVDDPDDNMVLACAIAAKADFIVSGDRHLLSLGAYKSTLIRTVVDFLSELE